MTHNAVTPSVEFANPFLIQALEHQRTAEAEFTEAARHPGASLERSTHTGRGNRALAFAKISSQIAVAYALEPTVQARRGRFETGPLG